MLSKAHEQSCRGMVAWLGVEWWLGWRGWWVGRRGATDCGGGVHVDRAATRQLAAARRPDLSWAVPERCTKGSRASVSCR